MESGEERREQVAKVMSTVSHDNIQILPLTTLEQFERCVVLQLEVWGYSDGDLIPRRVFLVAQRIGGQGMGAFDGATTLGFAMTLPVDRTRPASLYSPILAVLPGYR